MIVMMIAKTPSLNASSRVLPTAPLHHEPEPAPRTGWIVEEVVRAWFIGGRHSSIEALNVSGGASAMKRRDFVALSASPLLLRGLSGGRAEAQSTGGMFVCMHEATSADHDFRT